jgi:hypothetical protein
MVVLVIDQLLLSETAIAVRAHPRDITCHRILLTINQSEKCGQKFRLRRVLAKNFGRSTRSERSVPRKVPVQLVRLRVDRVIWLDVSSDKPHELGEHRLYACRIASKVCRLHEVTKKPFVVRAYKEALPRRPLTPARVSDDKAML